MENQGPGGDRFEDGVIMSGHKDRRPLVIDIAQQAQKLGGEIGVEVAGGLIGENQSWLVGKGSGDRDTLLLSSRESIRESRLPMLQTEAPEHFHSPAMGFARRDTMDAQDEGDVLEHGLAPQKLEILKDHADLAAQQRQPGSRHLVDPSTRNPHLALGRVFGGVEQAQQRSLASARWSGQKNELTGVDLEVEVIENDSPLVFLGDGTEANHRLESARFNAFWAGSRRSQ